MIERGYEHHSNARSWLAAMINQVARAAEPDYLAAVYYVLGPRGPEEPKATILNGGLTLQDVETTVARGWAMGTRADTLRLATQCRRPGISSLRKILGDAAVDGWLERCRDSPLVLEDAVAVSLCDGGGKPILLSWACSRARAIPELESALWYRIAIHLSAGVRLAGRQRGGDAPDVEVVLTAEGQVAHAQGAGASAEASQLLRRAARDIDRARTRVGRADPLAALDLWQGLLAGRWSLVEHFDSDGKRFLLARRNDPGILDPEALTRRQRQTVFYASLGLSTKEIAYALGLAENTVSTHLSAGLRRLRMKSRAELIRTSNELVTAALAALDDPTSS